MGRKKIGGRIVPAIQIPLTSQSEKFRISIDDEFYTFRVLWNTRMEQWVLSILDSNEDPVIAGLVLVPGENLFEQYNLPLTGTMYLVPSEKVVTDPSYEDLGQTHFLIYEAEDA